MHRRGGKRIRMDDPPPEYVNPMTPATPATPMTEYGGQSVHEPEAQNENYNGFNAGAPANSTTAEPPREEAEESHQEEEDARSPSPAPTKRVTRSRGRRGDGGYVGRLAESPPPPPLRSRRGRGGRGRGRGRGSAPPPAHSPPPVLLPGDDENSLYNILRFNKTAINQVVDMWIEEYKSNREAALVQLMQFFINSSGCRGKVSPDMAQMDHTLIIKKMTQEFDEESGEYPLIMTGQTWKKFKASFCEFIQTLVKMCQYSIIYDQYLMDNIISLLTGLSDSQVRAFRHTATLAVMKLMTALVDVALLTSVNCDNCLRQYEAERLKARDKRATERLEVLVAKRQELEENMEEIKNMLTYMFKSVFVHRYRDTLPEIRSITMAEIGIWMEKFPAHFLDDLYLKYIGWTLHDKVGEVRLRCLQALQPLYECEELKGKLELFTSKFKDRIVSMSLDKETEVAVRAVKLVIAILKMHPDVLTDKDCENVYELVYSSWRAVAAAAGEFLNVRLFRAEEATSGAAASTSTPSGSTSSAATTPSVPPASATPLRSRRGKQRLPATPLIRDLVQFFIESELHEHGAYLVDSLIESNPMMKDWECMTDLLLEEAGPGEEALDNRQESSLIELMVCCVRQASTGEPPVGRGPSRKHHHMLTKEQTKIINDDRAKMTAHFIVTLPALLDKFGADPEKLTNLVSIPQYFDLELYTTQRQEGNLSLLLNKLREIVCVQTEAEVLEICGRTLEYLCSEGCSVYSKCNVARATITDACVNKYKEAIDDYRTLIEGGETPDADEVFNVINSLRKVSIMYMCHNLNDTNIWESLFEDLPKCLKQNETQMPPQALVYGVRACFYSVIWSLQSVEERGGAGVGAEAGVLRDRLHAYCTLCKDIVANGITTELREEAYTSICDLLIFFSEHLYSLHHPSEPAMKQLVYEPDNDLCDLLNTFIQEFVFVHHNYDGQDERRIEELHKRRNFLAAYCKLIVYNVAPIRRAADVFKHYIKCYNDYGDIIKATLSKAREINKLNCALTMELAMQSLFTDMTQKHQNVHNKLSEFQDLKELAKRFSVMFGLDALKNREALTALHRAGIAFAALQHASPSPAHSPHSPHPTLIHTTVPHNILFLEPLSEFSNKLLRQDKRQVLKFLESRIPHSVQWGEEWAPLMTYRNSLLTDAPEERLPPTRKHYARKQRGGQTEEDDQEENPDSEQDQPGYKRRIRLPVKRLNTNRLSVQYKTTKFPRVRTVPPSSDSSVNYLTSPLISTTSDQHSPEQIKRQSIPEKDLDINITEKQDAESTRRYSSERDETSRSSKSDEFIRSTRSDKTDQSLEHGESIQSSERGKTDQLSERDEDVQSSKNDDINEEEEYSLDNPRPKRKYTTELKRVVRKMIRMSTATELSGSEEESRCSADTSSPTQIVRKKRRSSGSSDTSSACVGGRRYVVTAQVHRSCGVRSNASSPASLASTRRDSPRK